MMLSKKTIFVLACTFGLIFCVLDKYLTTEVLMALFR